MNEENREQINKDRKGIGIIPQVAIFFAIGVLISGLIALVSLRARSDSTIRRETEAFAEEVAEDVALSVGEFPAHEWLLQYWYEHADELDIEYDVTFGPGTETERKATLLAERYPGLSLRYADADDIAALAPEDRKLYAEVAYSWLITRVNEIKWSHDADFLFCVLTDDSCETQFFLFSAASMGAERGTNYEEVYPLGVTVTVSESQRDAMKSAVRDKSYLAPAGKYVDYYAYMGDVGGMHSFIGLTYDLQALTHEVNQQTGGSAVLAMLYQIIQSSLCLLLLFAFVLKPLQKILRSLRRYKDDKDSSAISEALSGVHPHNEIGKLSEDVVDLAKEMDDHVKNIASITAEKERIGAELDLAYKIQESMLPHDFPAFPDRREFDIYATMDPAKEVGGDFYDYFLVDDDHLCLVIADVSGKGVPAALFMMASKIILSNNAMMGKSPAEILTDANAMICSNNPEDMFVTVWLGILEISTGKLIAANAGHEYPAVRDPGGSFELLQDKHGLVIGAMDGIRYKEYELQLEPGSKIFLYTDGVPEADNADKEMFGTDKMLDALNMNGHADPVEIMENIKAAIDDFVQEAEQFDDLTMLCIEYNGPKPDEGAAADAVGQNSEDAVPALAEEAAAEPLHDEIMIDALPENLPKVMEFVESRLETAGCPAGTISMIGLSVEELFVNIAKYAYAPETGSARIGLDIMPEQREVMITFADSGMPYNPLEKEDPDVHLSADDRPIGGLGVYLVKETMDSVTYERAGYRNVLTIKKRY